MTALVTRDLCVPSPASVENAVKGDEKWELQFYSLGIIAVTLSQSFSPLVCRLPLTTASRRATGQVLLPASWPAGCLKTAGILMPICREIRREEDTVCLSCLFLLLALWMTYGKMSHQIPICRTTLAQILYNLKPEWTFEEIAAMSKMTMQYLIVCQGLSCSVQSKLASLLSQQKLSLQHRDSHFFPVFFILNSCKGS